jgi:hypothetical protein
MLAAPAKARETVPRLSASLSMMEITIFSRLPEEPLEETCCGVPCVMRFAVTPPLPQKGPLS